jgi:hypothetical protein
MKEPLPRLVSSGLPDNHRRRLAEHWSHAALLEHASVGSFAKFSFHLLAVGAPPAMLQACHQAALDEIHHARLCFALASVYEGSLVGPGPLAIPADVVGATDMLSIMGAVIEEGCVGETIASLEAAEALELATDPQVCEALKVIARDEANHAELAWKFVAWALATSSSEIQQAIYRMFRSLLIVSEQPTAVPRNDVSWSDELVAHGCLSPQRRQHIQQRARYEILMPAAKALFGNNR